MSDHYSFVRQAIGNVFIAGLGIGMVLYNLLEKENVKHVDVIEISPEVIALVAPWYKEHYGDRVNIFQGDVLEYTPPKNTHYDAVWFDIWDNICVDNLDEMSKLHRRWARKADVKGSWAKEICQMYKRRDKSYY
jgi:spermidine synthase